MLWRHAAASPGWADCPVNLAQSQDCGSGEKAADGMQERGSLFPEEVVPVTRLEMISLQKSMGIFGEARNKPCWGRTGERKRKRKRGGGGQSPGNGTVFAS